MKEPKDFQLARRAYEAFFDEQPQVWFENLGHDYQMKWVRAIRAVMEELKGLRREPIVQSSESEQQIIAKARALIDSLPRRGKNRDLTGLTKEEKLNYLRARKQLWKRGLKA